ncbi:Cytochrome c4 [Halioglobus japonicus]|nr:Cytochrome c4 [Halioglobus japonicus]
MRKRLEFIGYTFLFLLMLPAAASAVAGVEEKYQPCAACHGEQAQGNVDLKAPALAGQDGAYLTRQLAHFKAGIRGADPRDTQGAQMKAMATTLSEDDIALLAEYLAALPQAVPVASVSGDLKNGNNYYHASCGACHGGEAQGNPGLNAPALVILDASYLKSQVQSFQQGLRGAHPDDKYGKQMKMMSNSLPSDKDLDDVIAYIQSLAVSP